MNLSNFCPFAHRKPMFSLLSHRFLVPKHQSISSGLADSLRSELLLYDISVHAYFPGTILSPGLAEENKTKPKVTQEIEGKVEALSCQDCAKGLLRGECSRGSSFIWQSFDLLADLRINLKSFTCISDTFQVSRRINFILRLTSTLNSSEWQWKVQLLGMASWISSKAWLQLWVPPILKREIRSIWSKSSSPFNLLKTLTYSSSSALFFLPCDLFFFSFKIGLPLWRMFSADPPIVKHRHEHYRELGLEVPDPGSSKVKLTWEFLFKTW